MFYILKLFFTQNEQAGQSDQTGPFAPQRKDHKRSAAQFIHCEQLFKQPFRLQGLRGHDRVLSRAYQALRLQLDLEQHCLGLLEQ